MATKKTRIEMAAATAVATTPMKDLIAQYNALAVQCNKPQRKGFDSKALAQAAINALQEAQKAPSEARLPETSDHPAAGSSKTPTAPISAEATEPHDQPARRPIAYVNARRQSFVYVGPQQPSKRKVTQGTIDSDEVKLEGFLTFRTGQVAIEYLHTPSLQPVATTQRSIQELVRHYVKSQLPKSELAREVIDAILTTKDLTQTDFITPVAQRAALVPAASKKLAEKHPRAAAKTGPGLVAVKGEEFVSLATLAEQLGLEPRKVRAVLRKRMTKPAIGWLWSPEEAAKVKINLGKWVRRAQ